MINQLINDLIRRGYELLVRFIDDLSHNLVSEPRGDDDVRVSQVIDRSLRMADVISIDRRDRVTGLIKEIADEMHATGLIKDHADPNVTTDWVVNGVESCRYPLCVAAVQAIRDIERAARHFPIG